MPTLFGVRTFTPIDLPLIHRLVPQGVSLDSATALTQGIHVVEGAVMGTFPLADLGMPTFVLREGESGYIAQFRHKNGDPHAHIVFIAPSLKRHGSDLAWLRLLNAMVAAAGRRSAHTLRGEVAETGDEFALLREAGFATYTRQEIWRRDPGPLPARDKDTANVLRTGSDLDAFALAGLHVAVVPRMVRQAEAAPDAKQGLLYEHKGRLGAHVTLQEGKYGIYLQGLFRPDLSDAEMQRILAAALANAPRAEKLPVYVRVPRYQEHLERPLAALGFNPGPAQAVMVRHTTRRVEDYALKPIHALDSIVVASGPPVKECSAPFHDRVSMS
jgi:hypothetical protein